jgi:hypothetical protein
MYEDKLFGEILVDLQVLVPAEVNRILEAQSRRRDRLKFGQVARDMGLLRDEHILAALAVQMNLFPGIKQMSLNAILRQLETADGQRSKPQPRPLAKPPVKAPRRMVASDK